MHRIEYDQNKSIVYDARLNILDYRTSGKCRPLSTEEQKITLLLELARARRRAPEESRTLYTAFLMKIAQGLTGYRSAVKSMEGTRRRISQEDKDAVKEILDDVLRKKLSVHYLLMKLT